MSGQVIYIVRSWPRWSQTFIVNEVLALERRGVDLVVFSLVRSGEELVQPQVADVRSPVHYLEDELRRPLSARLRTQVRQFLASPLRYALVLWFCLRNAGLAAGYGECSTLGCFLHAVTVAETLDDERATSRPAHVHAHFAHDPALVGMLVARLTGLPFSFTAHARDLVEIPPTSLAARAARATALVTCCAANADYIDTAVPADGRPPVLVIHHGVDLERFVPTPRDEAPAVPRLLSVGRLVEKKGYDDLLHALAAVRDHGLAFSCRILGDGPMLAELADLCARLDLHQVELAGARSSEQVVAALKEADVFVLTPRVVDTGDRDGIPNVLVEAMAAELPVVSTAVSGIPELVDDGHNGLLVAPDDPAALADAMLRLADDPDERHRFAAAGAATVARDFDGDALARRMAALFGTVHA
jgi:glycosyltransferase involved in cell wall biosynthesis